MGSETMDCTIGDRTFRYQSGCRDDRRLRGSFNALTRKIYGFDFEQWHRDGYWGNNYVPHFLTFEERVVANVSVSVIEFGVMGGLKKYAQIGTVMTDPDFRQSGLSRFLMERVMADWSNRYDLIYLYANDDVLRFYPKFGFAAADEYLCVRDAAPLPRAATVEKAAMSDARNRRKLEAKIRRSKPLSPLSMRNNMGLVMFYCTDLMRDNVFYLPGHDAYAVAENRDGELRLLDVFCEQDTSLDTVIGALSEIDTQQISLGFTPWDRSSFEERLLREDGTTLFVFGRDAALLQTHRLRFPALSHT